MFDRYFYYLAQFEFRRFTYNIIIMITSFRMFLLWRTTPRETVQEEILKRRSPIRMKRKPKTRKEKKMTATCSWNLWNWKSRRNRQRGNLWRWDLTPSSRQLPSPGTTTPWDNTFILPLPLFFHWDTPDLISCSIRCVNVSKTIT